MVDKLIISTEVDLGGAEKGFNELEKQAKSSGKKAEKNLKIKPEIQKPDYDGPFREIPKLARDTKVALDKNRFVQLELNVTAFQKSIKKAKADMKLFQKLGMDSKANKLQIDINAYTRQLTEAKRKLNNYTNTGDENLSRLQAKFNKLSESLRVTDDDFKKFGTSSKEIEKITKRTSELQKKYDEGLISQTQFRKGLEDIRKSVENQQTPFEKFRLTLSRARNALLIFAFATSFLRGAFNELARITELAIKNETAFAMVQKTVEGTAEQFGVLRKELFDLTTQIPLTFQELSKIAEIGGQLGVKTGDISKFTKDVALITASSNLTAEQASADFASIANIMKLPIARVGEMSNVVIRLGNETNSTEAEILEFTKRIAGAGNVAGMAYGDVFAISSALASLGVNAESGGTAVSKAVNQINRDVIKGSDTIKEYARVAGISASEFSQSWEKDAGETFRMFVEGLGKEGKNAVITIQDLFGEEVRLSDAFTRLALSGGKLTETYGIMRDELTKNNAVQKEANILFQTTENQIKITQNEIDKITSKRGDATKGVKLYFKTAELEFLRSFGDIKDLSKQIADLGRYSGPKQSVFFVDVEDAKKQITELERLRDIADSYFQFKEVSRLTEKINELNNALESGITKRVRVNTFMSNMKKGFDDIANSAENTVSKLQTFIQQTQNYNDRQAQSQKVFKSNPLLLQIIQAEERVKSLQDKINGFDEGTMLDTKILARKDLDTAQSVLDDLNKKYEESTDLLGKSIKELERRAEVEKMRVLQSIPGELQRAEQIKRIEHQLQEDIASLNLDTVQILKLANEELQKENEDAVNAKIQGLERQAEREKEIVLNSTKDYETKAKEVEKIEEKYQIKILKIKQDEQAIYELQNKRRLDDAKELADRLKEQEEERKKKAEEANKKTIDGVKDVISALDKYVDGVKKVEDGFTDLKRTAILSIAEINKEIQGKNEEQTKTTEEYINNTLKREQELQKDLIDEQRTLQENRAKGILSDESNAETLNKIKEINNELDQIRQTRQDLNITTTLTPKTEFEDLTEKYKQEQEKIALERKSLDERLQLFRASRDNREILVKKEGEEIIGYYKNERGELVKLNDFKNIQEALTIAEKRQELLDQLNIVKQAYTDEVALLKDKLDKQFKAETDYKTKMKLLYKGREDDYKEHLREMASIKANRSLTIPKEVAKLDRISSPITNDTKITNDYSNTVVNNFNQSNISAEG